MSTPPSVAPPRKTSTAKKVLVGLAVFLIIFFGFVQMQPPQFTVERSIKIAAPASTVYANLDDFHKWEAWSPWAKLDPNMKTTYSGADKGVGATYSWTGDDKVGEGVMKITENRPDELVKIDLDFIRPFAAKNVTEFRLKPDGNQTEVTWKMSGDKNFMMKLVHLFMNMDKLVGADFEKGLTQLKAVSETGQPAAN